MLTSKAVKEEERIAEERRNLRNAGSTSKWSRKSNRPIWNSGWRWGVQGQQQAHPQFVSRSLNRDVPPDHFGPRCNGTYEP